MIKRGWRRQTEIADEFGESLPSLIISLRKEKNNWEAIALILGVGNYTLRRWVKEFGIQDDKRIYNNFNRHNLLEHRATKLGYQNFEAMVIEYRSGGKMLKELAAVLGCNAASLSRRLPIGIRGEWVLDPSQKKNNTAGGHRDNPKLGKWSLERYGTSRTNATRP